MKTVSLILIFACMPGLAVYHGTQSADDSVVAFPGGGSGVMLRPEVVITVDHVARAEDYAGLKFTNADDARDFSKIPENHIGSFKAGKTLAPRAIYTMAGTPPRARHESVTLLLVADADRKKFAKVKFPMLADKLPPPNVRVVGYGETGLVADGKNPVRGIRNEGTVVNGFAYPEAAYMYETQRGPTNQITLGGDSGGALRDDECLYGLHLLVLTAPPGSPYLPPSERLYGGTALLIAEKKFRAEIEEILRGWKLIK